MLKNIFIFLLLFGVSLQAHKDQGHHKDSNKNHLVSILTQNKIVLEFDLPIVENSLKPVTIQARKHKHHKKIANQVFVEDNNKLIIEPDYTLEKGKYTLRVKPLRLKKCESNLNWFERWYKKDRCIIHTKPIHHNFEIKHTLLSIDFNQTIPELKEGDTTSISIYATYDDNITQDITNEVVWNIENSSIIKIEDGNITALNEGSTALQVSYNGITSTPIEITVYKEINGYKLPPEPDETLNNSTILGIDVNNNGVRDDVERKVIETYQELIKIELMMVYSKVAQKILENPVGDALENQKEFEKASNCSLYLEDLNISMGGVSHIDFFENNTFNTKARVRAYLDYNLALSGGVYGSSPSDWNRDACDFDVESLLGGVK